MTTTPNQEGNALPGIETPEIDRLGLSATWEDYTGAGVRVAVLSDGFDHVAHPELIPNYDVAAAYNFVDGNANALPGLATDNDGTPLMGIVGAARNGFGTVGIAHEATLVGYRIDEGVDTARQAFELMAEVRSEVALLDVGDYRPFYARGPMQDLEAAIANVVENGNEGRGTAIVKGAGDTRGFSDANSTFAASERFMITVAATNVEGEVAAHSANGGNILVSVLDSESGIETTDRVGTPGLSRGDYVEVGGTDAAAAEVAGIVALMYEANPDLGWRDVQTILAYTARHTGSAINGTVRGHETAIEGQNNSWIWNGADNWNGGGLHFSNDYGFGLVDAAAAVRLAEHWEIQTATSATALDRTVRAYYLPGEEKPEGQPFDHKTINEPVVVDDVAGTEITAWQWSFNLVETVDLTVDFTATGAVQASDLVIYLTSPSGTTAQLYAGGDGMVPIQNKSWTFTSQAFRGELSHGDWIIRFEDRTADSDFTPDGDRTPIEFDGLSLFIAGQSVNKDDAFNQLEADRWYIFTDEFSDYAGQFGHATTITGYADQDPALASETLVGLNGAPLTGDMILDFDTGAGVIDGVEVVLAGYFSDVVTGAGNDQITLGDIVLDASFLPGRINRLWTGSGDDFVEASFADNGFGQYIRVHLGDGDDTFRRGAQAYVYGEDGDDELAGAGALYGGRGNDILIATYEPGTTPRLPDMVGSSGFDTADYSIFDGPIQVDEALQKALYSNDLPDARFEAIEKVIGTAHGDTYKYVDKLRVIEAGDGDDGFVPEHTALTGISLFGGEGRDFIRYNSLTLTGVEFDLQAGFARHANKLDYLYSIEDLFATQQDDVIRGSAADNELHGLSGNDVIETVGGDDTVFGDEGDDLIIATSGDQILNGGAGTDVIRLLSTGEGYFGGDGEIHGNPTPVITDDRLELADGSVEGVSLFDLRDYRIDGIAELRFLDEGHASDKTLRLSFAVNVQLHVQGVDAEGAVERIEIYKSDNSGIDLSQWTFGDFGGQGDSIFIRGTGQGEFFAGSVMDDRIEGLGGDDVLNGMGGDDTILGGGGDDTITHSLTTGDVAGEVFNGGTGHDRLIMSMNGLGANTSRSIDMRDATLAGFEELVFDGDADNQDLTLVFSARQFALAFGAGAEVRGRDAAGADEALVLNLGTDTGFDGSTVGFNDWGDQRVLINGSAGDDAITGTVARDLIGGSGGNDRLDGFGGLDEVSGGAGDDVVVHRLSTGDVAGESFDGGEDVDTLLVTMAGLGGASRTVDMAGAIATGFEALQFGGDVPGQNLTLSFTALQWLENFAADSQIIGNAIGGTSEVLAIALVNLDTFDGSALGFTDWAGSTLAVVGANTADTITGSIADDWIAGGTGNDVIRGLDGDDSLSGEDGNDALVGGLGNDTIDGGAGIDTALFEGTVNTVVRLATTAAQNTGHGTDTITGIENVTSAGGNDRLNGDGAANTLRSGAGNDRLYGYDGDDRLYAGSGDDLLAGGAGDDILGGSSGADIFVFTTGLGADTIIDFTDDVDAIRLDQDIWGGGLTAAEVVGTFGSIVGADALLDFGGGDSILVRNVSSLALLENDLMLA